MADKVAIQVQDLQKRFGDIEAVGGIDFEVQSGEIFSLLGPNGAGKTTTISIISCLLRPDGGDVRVLGSSVLDDPQVVKSFFGVVPQEIALLLEYHHGPTNGCLRRLKGILNGWTVVSLPIAFRAEDHVNPGRP